MKNIEELKQENAKLKQLLNDVVMYGDSYNEWVVHYGTNQMTMQKQTFDRLMEKIKNAKNFLKR